MTLRHGLSLLGINLLVLLTGLLAIELAFGNWLGGTSYGMLNLPRNVRREFDVRHLYGEPRPAVYTRDANGLRGEYPALAAIGILVLGGSTTNELYVTDGATWVDMLRRELAAAGAPQVVVNAGVDGQSTVGHLRNFEVWFPNLAGLKPKLVLAYVGINDMNLAAGTQDKFDAMLADGMLRRWKNYMANHSALWRGGEIVAGALRARNAKLVHGDGDPYAQASWRPYLSRGDEPSATADELEAYRARLRELAWRIQAMGAVPVFVTQTANGYRLKNGRLFGRDVNGSVAVDPYHRLAAFNAATLGVCDDLRMACVDAGAMLEMEDGDFYDYVHTTPQGSAKVGKAVAGGVLPLLP